MLMPTIAISVSTQKELYGYKFISDRASSFPMLRPRIPTDAIFVLGGWSRDGVCPILETYDDRVHEWFKVV